MLFNHHICSRTASPLLLKEQAKFQEVIPSALPLPSRSSPAFSPTFHRESCSLANFVICLNPADISQISEGNSVLQLPPRYYGSYVTSQSHTAFTPGRASDGSGPEGSSCSWSNRPTKLVRDLPVLQKTKEISLLDALRRLSFHSVIQTASALFAVQGGNNPSSSIKSIC